MKKIMSWVFTIPALMVLSIDFGDIRFEWLRFGAIVMLVCIAMMNHIFEPEQVPKRRRINENNNYYRYLARRNGAGSY